MSKDKKNKYKESKLKRRCNTVTVCKQYDIKLRKNPRMLPKLPELKNEFDKVAGYKTNIHKFVAFHITMNNQKEKLKKQSHLQFTQKE